MGCSGIFSGKPDASVAHVLQPGPPVPHKHGALGTRRWYEGSPRHQHLYQPPQQPTPGGPCSSTPDGSHLAPRRGRQRLTEHPPPTDGLSRAAPGGFGRPPRPVWPQGTPRPTDSESRPTPPTHSPPQGTCRRGLSAEGGCGLGPAGAPPAPPRRARGPLPSPGPSPAALGPCRGPVGQRRESPAPALTSGTRRSPPPAAPRSRSRCLS